MEEPFATAGVTSMMAVDLTSRVGKAAVGFRVRV